MKTITKTHLAFESAGDAVAGNLFLPEGGEPVGAVVTVGPLTSVKEQATGSYVQALAERGYAALAFDYRGFGESEGEPRQFESPEANIEDIRNAAAALLADERLGGLPVFGLGVCFGWPDRLLRRPGAHRASDRRRGCVLRRARSGGPPMRPAG
jgi:uncharacterized protein